ncbi:MAG TPA: nickel-dependent lactate racemase [Terriglobales bacterium]
MDSSVPITIELAFGKSGLEIELPQKFHYHFLEPRWATPLSDPAAEIGAALDAPIASLPIVELARNKRSAAISVCDITRPVPNRLLLPPLLSRLEAGGIPRDGITILIATGLHRPATTEEISEICGESVATNYRVVNHDARNISEHCFLGTTASGIPVHIDDRFVSADLHITLGFIEPHLMLGFSGGRKLIAPGLAAQETIKVIHSSKFMRDPRSFEGNVHSNPLHYELLEIARMARHDFMLDVALTRGTGQRPIAGVFAGSPVEAHKAGMKFVSNLMLEEIKSPVDAVITSAAGYPLDLTFYQSLKGITAAQHVVKPGGKILLMAACTEGIGGHEFGRMVETNVSDRDFMERIANAPVEIDQWQLEKLGMVTANIEVLYYVPGLPQRYLNKLWGKAYMTAASAIEALTSSLSVDASIAVISEGPYVLARAGAIS